MDEHDSLGRNVCKNCAESIMKFYTFHLMYTKSNQKLRELLSQTIDTKTISITSKLNDYNEVDIPDVESIVHTSPGTVDSKFNCTKCSACFNLRSQLRTHVDQLHRNDGFKNTGCSSSDNSLHRWKCTYCMTRFRTRDLKNKHQKECRQLNSSAEMNETSELNESEFVDYNDFDNESDENTDALAPREFKYEVHSKLDLFDEGNSMVPLKLNEMAGCDVNNVVGEPWKCKKCSKCFETSKLLRQHHCSQHQEPVDELLLQANIKQEQVEFEVLHLKTENERTEYDATQQGPNFRWICKTCFLVFETRELLRIHRRNHLGIRRLQPSERTVWNCNICNEIFSSRDKHRLHRELQHPKQRKGRKSDDTKNWGDVGEYFCELCNKMFLSKSKIRKHMDVHKNKDRPKRLCTICGLELCSTYNLNNHIRTVHGRERKFHCILCDRRFSHSHHLKTHMNRHEGIRPFQCNLCVKAFYDKTTLREHVKSVHLNLKAYACRICSRTFNRSGNMRAHMLKTHHLGDLTGIHLLGTNNRSTGIQSIMFTSPVSPSTMGESVCS